MHGQPRPVRAEAAAPQSDVAGRLTLPLEGDGVAQALVADGIEQDQPAPHVEGRECLTVG